MLAGALALGLTACDEPSASATTPQAAQTAAEAPTEQLAAATAEAERIEREYAAREEAENRRKLDLIGAETQLGGTLKRNERYHEYHLVQQRGAAVPGREFEAAIMCKNVFDAADYNMWALQNLVITGSSQGMTSFLGLVDGQRVEISLVINEERHVPTFLIMGGTAIAACE
ncbi:hypothetical protein [Brevundimonas sp. Root1279]|uniref:hypothetical protein n=1 Tax=Brevundimonas sp. Root1279 TaxID=1736443 RepID=UPI000A4AED1C|nr:hypothetical protein [Brevundimonas sp. Root1279]